MKLPPTQKELKAILKYDPDTGLFIWLVRAANNVPAGASAGNVTPHGYIVIRINKRGYMAHRLAFLYMTGEFPPKSVDHISGIKNDNRWHNLRKADEIINGKNMRMNLTNTSGFNGVTWNKKCKKWAAQARKNGKSFFIGTFDSFDDAKQARIKFNKENDYSERHGEAA